MSDTTTVSFRVIRIAPTKECGRLIALASAVIELDGVELTVQGFQVRRERPDLVSIDVPHYRGDDGRWYPAVLLPDEMREAIAAEIWAVMNPEPDSAA